MSRKFNWVSSSDQKNKELLNDLNNRMIDFYSQSNSRDEYQEMLDKNDNDGSNPGIVTEEFIKYLKSLSFKTILEIGCGSGRIYQFIKEAFAGITYTGIELSETVIKSNRMKYPDQQWYVAGAYDIPFKDESADVCFSFYVLEHLVFPEKALNEMLRTIKKGGYLILIFPDFVSSGRLSSQNIGYSNLSTAKEKILKGRIIDAFVSLYDSRFRLPKSLNNAVSNVGAFPVNLNPKCLQVNFESMAPDVDAVYISSKKEIKNWAKRKGFEVVYPSGEEGLFLDHAFISIKK